MLDYIIQELNGNKEEPHLNGDLKIMRWALCSAVAPERMPALPMSGMSCSAYNHASQGN